ncbi:hypothetical protein FRB93_004176 [Tulasnella sp. JGI-2019a]|nr:hypothetical protein FRB93_004176 [Tulasnella sp. JGI-2019a]
MMIVHKIAASQSNATVDALVEFLTPFLPSSFCIIAHLRTLPRQPDLTVYSSFDLNTLNNNAKLSSSPPSLFSIATQCKPILIRYFCSGERSINVDTNGTAELHVQSFFSEWVPAILRESGGHPCLVGSLNHRWVPFLRKWTSRAGPETQKYVSDKRTRESKPQTRSLQAGFISVPLSVLDIPRVIETSNIPRSREYILARLPYSLCLRRPDEEAGSSKLAGWALIHEDGSIGALWVEPEFRGNGFSRYIVDGLVQKQLELVEGDGENLCTCVDVSTGNIAAERLFTAMGWKPAWRCFWVTVVPSDSPEVIYGK